MRGPALHQGLQVLCGAKCSPWTVTTFVKSRRQLHGREALRMQEGKKPPWGRRRCGSCEWRSRTDLGHVRSWVQPRRKFSWVSMARCHCMTKQESAGTEAMWAAMCALGCGVAGAGRAPEEQCAPPTPERDCRAEELLGCDRMFWNTTLAVFGQCCQCSLPGKVVK